MRIPQETLEDTRGASELESRRVAETIREQASELESRRLAEASREQEWRHPSFLRELFQGRFRVDLLEPYSAPPVLDRPGFVEFFERFQRFIGQEVDPGQIDATGEYSPHVVDGLRRLGAFGMKIPTEYGGLGFSAVEYSRVLEYLGSVDANIAALLSAHQSIGVPQPIKLFGTLEQKQRFLPRCAAGSISAFALTEPMVGSDPANMTTTAEPTPDGEAFLLNGEKLWCTNGTLAELLVVMARQPQTGAISAMVVETSWPGVIIQHRCRFMGLRALANAVIRFDQVRVPRENLIGAEGEGLRIALVTLNTGRLSVPAVTLGGAKQCLEISRSWSNARVQWGLPIGRHEIIAHRLADMAATTYAMECVSDLCAQLADSGRFDIRLEAAAAKEWNSTRAWNIIDSTLQIRGGRGYETAASLAARGEPAIPVERMFRDSRINLIFEGTSEIMHLFMAREAVDFHLKTAGALIDPDRSLAQKLSLLPQIVRFYAAWYPRLWLGGWRRFRRFGRLARHVRFTERQSRRLARAIFHGMLVFGGGLQRRQAFLFRAVDIGLELFAMAASISRAYRLAQEGSPDAPAAMDTAELFCRTASRRIDGLFEALWRNDDAARRRFAREVLEGNMSWLEAGIAAMEAPGQAWTPPAVIGA